MYFLVDSVLKSSNMLKWRLSYSIHYSAVQYRTIQCSTIQCNSVIYLFRSQFLCSDERFSLAWRHRWHVAFLRTTSSQNSFFSGSNSKPIKVYTIGLVCRALRVGHFGDKFGFGLKTGWKPNSDVRFRFYKNWVPITHCLLIKGVPELMVPARWRLPMRRHSLMAWV